MSTIGSIVVDMQAKTANLEAGAKRSKVVMSDFAKAIELQMNTQVALTEQLFQSTHTGREIALRDLTVWADEMRNKWASHEEMLTLISKTEAAKRAKIEADYATGGGVSNSTMLRSMGKATKPLAAASMYFDDDSGRMIKTVMAIDMAGATYEKLKTVAKEAGIGAMAGMAGITAAVGLAVAGVAAFVSHIETIQKRMDDIQKDSEDFAKREAARHNTTARGGQLQTELEAAQKELAEAQKAKAEGHSGYALYDFFFKLPGVISSAEDEAKKADDERLNNAQLYFASVQKQVKEQSELYRKNNADRQQAEVDLARLSTMAEGPERKKLELLSRQAEERRKALEENAAHPGSVDMGLLEQKFGFEAAGEDAKAQADAAKEREQQLKGIRDLTEGFAEHNEALSTSARLAQVDKAAKELLATQNDAEAQGLIANARAWAVYLDQQDKAIAKGTRIAESFKSLRNEIMTAGMNGSQKKLFDLKELGASEDEISEFKSLIDELDAVNKAKEHAKHDDRYAAASIRRFDFHLPNQQKADIQVSLTQRQIKLQEDANKELAKIAKNHPEAAKVFSI